MLDWKEVKGYNPDVVYWKNQELLGLPDLGEEVLIKTMESERIFQGHFTELWVNPFRIGNIVISDGLATHGELKDGIKWAKFNKPDKI